MDISGIEAPYRVERILTAYEDVVAEEDMTAIIEQEEESELDILMRQNPLLTFQAIEGLLRKEEEAKAQPQAQVAAEAPTSPQTN